MSLEGDDQPAEQPDEQAGSRAGSRAEGQAVGPAPGGEPDAPEATTQGRRRRRPWAIVVAVVSAIVCVAAIAAAFVRLPYRIIAPGQATPVSDVVEVRGTKTYSHPGSLLFLTVSVSNRDPNVYRYLTALLDPDSEIVDREEILGHGSQRDDNRLNQQLMDESEITAKAVALRRLGYEVPVRGDGATIVQVSKGSAADGVLRPGDVVTSADGQAVHVADELGPIVRRHRPGEPVSVTFERAGEPRTVTLTSGQNQEHQAFLGIAVLTRNLRYDFPVDVRIDPGPVSGPSAGLAFTLTVLQELTKADLTGGRRVATTGTIEPDGSVGEVGGVKQKAVTARRAGATLMLVPRSELREAKRHAGTSMKVVGVRNLDEALAALHAAGGARIPPAAELRPAA